MTTAKGPDFTSWYEREHAALVSSMVLVCGNFADAAEVADEAFTRALQHWERVGAMASPVGWTYRVAVNCAQRRWRRRTMEERLLRRIAPHPVTEGPAGEAWLLVADLPLRQRTAVVLRHVAQLTEPEIAAAMHVRRSTVSNTLRSAYAALAPRLAPDPLPEAGHA